MNYPKPNENGPALPPLRYLSSIHRTVRGIEEYLRSRTCGLDLPAGTSHLVSYLASYGPVPVGRLVDVFGIKKSTLTGSLDRLEQRGLLTRTLNPEDRRSFLVDLTAAGRRKAARVRIILEEFEQALDGELSAADRKAFTRVMAAITRITTPDPQEEP
ncbi:MAG: MarR family transcriptional regulator [bacterium]|nr:MarR family transcriptional regulator [bacterium]